MGHIEKYPGLYASAKANGIAYITALMRVKKGWSIEKACTTPVRAYGGITRLRLKKRVLVPRIVAPAQPRKVYRPRLAEDTAPARIRALRATFCDEFVKTGELNQQLRAQLQEYADAVRTPQIDPRRISDEPTVKRRGRPRRVAQDDGRGNAHQISGAAAGRIADFLRSDGHHPARAHGADRGRGRGSADQTLA